MVTENGGPIHILHNETATQNHWLMLNLIGHKSNRDAIGARVIVETDRVRKTRVVQAGSGLVQLRPASEDALQDGSEYSPYEPQTRTTWLPP